MVPLTLRSTVRRHASESTWVIGPIVSDPPAQCTTPFSRPCHAVAASTIRLTSSSLVTSAGSYLTAPAPSPACAVISSSAAASRSALRPTSTTLPPDATTAAATPLPMPLPPPVTMIVRSANESCTLPSIEEQTRTRSRIEPRPDAMRRHSAHRQATHRNRHARTTIRRDRPLSSAPSAYSRWATAARHAPSRRKRGAWRPSQISARRLLLAGGFAVAIAAAPAVAAFAVTRRARPSFGAPAPTVRPRTPSPATCTPDLVPELA